MEPTSYLSALPLELQNTIIDNLDIPSKLNFRLTSYQFQSIIPFPTHHSLLSAEKSPWAVQKRLYSCQYCVRLRPSSKFATAMTRGPKGLKGKEPHKRFCIECGIRSDKWGTRYSPGAEIEVEGKKWVLCKTCRGFKKEIGCVGSGLCRECHMEWRGEDCVCGEGVVGPSARAKKRRRMREWENMEDVYDDENFYEWYDPN